MRIFYPPDRELRVEGCGSAARIPAKQNDSKRGALPSFEVLVRPVAGGVQSAGANVRLDLTIPLVRRKFFKPFRKASQLGRGKFRNGGFDFFDAHIEKIRVGLTGAKRN